MFVQMFGLVLSILLIIFTYIGIKGIVHPKIIITSLITDLEGSSIQFKFICIAPFTIQSLQSIFTGNIFIYCRNLIYLTSS